LFVWVCFISHKNPNIYIELKRFFLCDQINVLGHGQPRLQGAVANSKRVIHASTQVEHLYPTHNAAMRLEGVRKDGTIGDAQLRF
jgi:hypothetical protein